jgi:carboxymethylenebutenolidase
VPVATEDRPGPWPGVVDALRKAADAAGIVADVKEYPQARHAFINRITALSPLTVALKVAGVGQVTTTTPLSMPKRRILAFFDVHVRSAIRDPADRPVEPL